VAAIGPVSLVTLGICLLVIVVAYGIIFATSERSPRELAWTILPAVLLLVLLVVSTQAALAR
jgi:hypothetical protein